MAIYIASSQGQTNKKVTKIYIAPVQGLITKEILEGHIASMQGAINKKFFPDWVLKTGIILNASDSGPLSGGGYTMYTANVTTSPAIRPVKIKLIISAETQLSASTAYCRVEYKKNGDWTFIDSKSFTIYTYLTNVNYDFDLPGNLSIDNIRYRLTNFGEVAGGAMMISNFAGRVTQWYEGS